MDSLFEAEPSRNKLYLFRRTRSRLRRYLNPLANLRATVRSRWRKRREEKKSTALLRATATVHTPPTPSTSTTHACSESSPAVVAAAVSVMAAPVKAHADTPLSQVQEVLQGAAAITGAMAKEHDHQPAAHLEEPEGAFVQGTPPFPSLLL